MPRLNRHAVLLIAISLTAVTGRAQAADAIPPLDARPQQLIATMTESPLKARLAACAGKPLRQSTFSIGHRGAPLHYPEHTRESYEAAATMGAGVIDRRDVHARQATGLPSRAERSAHDDGHTADSTRVALRGTFQSREIQ